MIVYDKSYSTLASCSGYNTLIQPGMCKYNAEGNNCVTITMCMDNHVHVFWPSLLLLLLLFDYLSESASFPLTVRELFPERSRERR